MRHCAVVGAAAGFDGEIGFGVDGVTLIHEALHHGAWIGFFQERTMIALQRMALAGLVAAGLAWPAAGFLRAPHDPRTTAKTLSQGLVIDGAGSFSVEYKALHFSVSASYPSLRRIRNSPSIAPPG